MKTISTCSLCFKTIVTIAKYYICLITLTAKSTYSLRFRTIKTICTYSLCFKTIVTMTTHYLVFKEIETIIFTNFLYSKAIVATAKLNLIAFSNILKFVYSSIAFTWGWGRGWFEPPQCRPQNTPTVGDGSFLCLSIWTYTLFQKIFIGS